MDYQKAVLDKVSTGVIIGSLRIKAALTHDDLAELLQLRSPRVIYEWEAGAKIPNVENLYNLAKIFNMKMEDLLVVE